MCSQLSPIDAFSPRTSKEKGEYSLSHLLVSQTCDAPTKYAPNGSTLRVSHETETWKKQHERRLRSFFRFNAVSRLFQLRGRHEHAIFHFPQAASLSSRPPSIEHNNLCFQNIPFIRLMILILIYCFDFSPFHRCTATACAHPSAIRYVEVLTTMTTKFYRFRRAPYMQTRHNSISLCFIGSRKCSATDRKTPFRIRRCEKIISFLSPPLSPALSLNK